jgi:hypothetical protein
MIIKFMKEIGIRSQNWSFPDIPKNINEALGYDLTDKHTTVASYGGVGNQTTNMHHGQGGKSDEADIDTEKFFALSKRLTITILVLPVCHLYWLHYQSIKIFHKVSNNLSLLPNGINVNPKSIELDELKDAWGVMEPI